MNFSNFIPRPFAQAEEREQRALQKIERGRQQRNLEKNIAFRWAALLDAVEKAKVQFGDLCVTIDRECGCDVADLAVSLNRGTASISTVATLVAKSAALKSIAPQLKAELRKLIVGAAESAAENFRREHAKIISKLPPLEKVEAPEWKPISLPIDHFLRGTSADTRVATGIFNSPGK